MSKIVRAQKRQIRASADADLRARARAYLRELRARIDAARTDRKARVDEVRAVCRANLDSFRARIAALRAELREVIKEKREEIARCKLAKYTTREAATRAVNDAIRVWAEERQLQAEIRRAEGRGKNAKPAKITAREKRKESDDEVRNNLTPELVPVWEAMKSKIRPGARMSRTEAFLQWAHDHSADVARLMADAAEQDADRRFAAMVEEEKRAAKALEKGTRRALESLPLDEYALDDEPANERPRASAAQAAASFLDDDEIELSDEERAEVEAMAEREREPLTEIERMAEREREPSKKKRDELERAAGYQAASREISEDGWTPAAAAEYLEMIRPLDKDDPRAAFDLGFNQRVRELADTRAAWEEKEEQRQRQAAIRKAEAVAREEERKREAAEKKKREDAEREERARKEPEPPRLSLAQIREAEDLSNSADALEQSTRRNKPARTWDEMSAAEREEKIEEAQQAWAEGRGERLSRSAAEKKLAQWYGPKPGASVASSDAWEQVFRAHEAARAAAEKVGDRTRTEHHASRGRDALRERSIALQDEHRKLREATDREVAAKLEENARRDEEKENGPIVMRRAGNGWRHYGIARRESLDILEMEPALLGGWKRKALTHQGADDWPGMNAQAISRWWKSNQGAELVTDPDERAMVLRVVEEMTPAAAADEPETLRVEEVETAPVEAEPKEGRKGGDRGRALEHAERLAALLEDRGLTAKAWQKGRSAVRVYLPGDQYLTIGADGSVSETDRGARTYDPARFEPWQREAVEEARRDLKHSMGEKAEEPSSGMSERARELASDLKGSFDTLNTSSVAYHARRAAEATGDEARENARVLRDAVANLDARIASRHTQAAQAAVFKRMRGEVQAAREKLADAGASGRVERGGAPSTIKLDADGRVMLDESAGPDALGWTRSGKRVPRTSVTRRGWVGSVRYFTKEDHQDAARLHYEEHRRLLRASLEERDRKKQKALDRASDSHTHQQRRHGDAARALEANP